LIIRPRPRAWQLLFILRGSIVPQVAPRVLSIGLLSVAVAALAHAHPATFAGISMTPFTLVGAALSIFLSFRNSACHARWWEGRQQWGQLIVDARRFARHVQTLLPGDRRVQETLLRGVIGFTHGLNARLRQRDQAQAMQPWLLAPLQAAASAPNPVDGVLHGLNRLLGEDMQAGRLDRFLYPALTAPLDSLGQVQAACERIAGTPLPFAYTLLLHRTALLFCVLLPFGLAGSLGWATPLLSMLLAYAFFGLDALGDQMEDPFGLEPNDLPLDAITRTVEIELLACLGVTPLPPPLLPQDHVLT
jgi:putative membrane protein